ncbi:MAG TPA: HAD-IB family hydrolase [Acidimicrobiales bacterium]|nr:HAD-IB family hydrolase [Acidimicrobiales bacterium]
MEAAFFDLDKTVIARASMVAFGRPLYSHGLISRRTVLRALYGQLVYLHLGASEQKLERIRDSVLALTKGWDRDQVREIVRETLDEVVEPIIYAEAIEEMENHRLAGRPVYLVSASPEEIVTPLADHLGVHGAIASRPRVDDQGRYTGEMAFYAYGPFKAEAMRALAERDGIDLEGSWAYSDSYTDVPMLEVVGRPVVVNPDRVLSKLAKERGWEIRTWERTVRLPTRRAPPGGAPGVAAAATAAGLVGAGIWWWRLRSRAAASPPPRRWPLPRSGAGASSWSGRLTRVPRELVGSLGDTPAGLGTLAAVGGRGRRGRGSPTGAMGVIRRIRVPTRH